MAELILTAEEKAASLWSDLSDEALGKLLKKRMLLIADAAKQMEETTVCAAALLLCCTAAESGAGQLLVELEDVAQGARKFGDWRVLVAKKEA